MALMHNRGRHNGSIRYLIGTGSGGGAIDAYSFGSGSAGHYPPSGWRRNLTAGEGISNELVGIPSGHRHPSAWLMPQKPGALAARSTVIGSGSATGSHQNGRNIEADISGSGTIPNTVSIGLIVTIAAAISASGGVTTAITQALATMVAEITGSGDIDAVAQGLADLGAELVGSGAVDPNNTALMDITASIVSYGSLTPEGIRDAVWSAVLANYPDAGTAGNTLALAGSGGVDYTALANAVWTRAERTLSTDGNVDVAGAVMQYAIESGWTIETMLRVFAAALAGKVSGAGTGTEVFRGINDDKDRITATVDSSGNRTAIILDAS